MASYITTATQREAIREATSSAKERAKQQDCIRFEEVLLFSGNTMRIAATPRGSVTRTVTAGWGMDGALWCSRKTHAIAAH